MYIEREEILDAEEDVAMFCQVDRYTARRGASTALSHRNRNGEEGRGEGGGGGGGRRGQNIRRDAFGRTGVYVRDNRAARKESLKKSDRERD